MQSRTWKSFLESSLNAETHHCISLHFDGLEEVPISACTLANHAYIEEQLKAGEKAIAIAVCDYTREALAYTLGLAIDDALCGRNRREYDADTWVAGDVVSLCGFNVEFRGFTDDSNFGRSISFTNLKNNTKTTRGLSFIPGRVQKCWDGAKPTSRRGGTFQDGVNAYKALSQNARTLHDAISQVAEPIIIATSRSSFLNVPPTKLSKAVVSINGERLSIQQCIKLAHIGSEGKLKECCEYELAGNPSVVSICRDEEGIGDLYYALEYIENGHFPRAVVIEAPEPETVDGMFGHLEDILAHDIPVIVFCDERTLRSTESFDSLSFKKLLWTQEALLELEETAACTSWNLTHREMCFAHKTVRIEAVVDSGSFPMIADSLFGISDRRSIMSEKGQQALSTIIRLFSDVLKQTEIATPELALGRISQLDSAVTVLNDPAYDSSLSNSDLHSLNEAVDALRDALKAEVTLPKEDVAYYAFKNSLTRDRKVCLITSNQLSAKGSIRYWQSLFNSEGLDQNLIRAVTPREFLKQECTPDDEDVFVSGWFNREMMEKVVGSGLSSVYSILLYRGDEVDLETNWYLSSSAFWKTHRNKLIKQSKNALADLGIDAGNTFSPIALATVQKKKDDDSSISKLVELMEEERAAQEKPVDDEASHLARPVYFTDGCHKWLRVPDSSTHLGGDTLIVIDYVRPGEADYTRKAAAALHQGDIVLKMDSDDDALEELCKKSFGSYEETMKIAKSWRRPIDEARLMMSDSAIKDRIINAGSKKTDQTILSWIRGDISIAPNKKRDIRAISKAFGDYFSDDEIDRIARAVRIVKGNRINTGKSISASIASAFTKDAMNGSLEEAAENFHVKHNLGTVKLLVVDYVGKPQMVSATRFGYYID